MTLSGTPTPPIESAHIPGVPDRNPNPKPRRVSRAKKIWSKDYAAVFWNCDTHDLKPAGPPMREARQGSLGFTQGLLSSSFLDLLWLFGKVI